MLVRIIPKTWTSVTYGLSIENGSVVSRAIDHSPPKRGEVIKRMVSFSPFHRRPVYYVVLSEKRAFAFYFDNKVTEAHKRFFELSLEERAEVVEMLAHNKFNLFNAIQRVVESFPDTDLRVAVPLFSIVEGI